MVRFYAECTNRLDCVEYGMSFWENANCAFDCLPLAAIVEEKIMCVHGGIGKVCISRRA
jgi:protein phosphatase